MTTFAKAFALGFAVATAMGIGFLSGWISGRNLFDAFHKENSPWPPSTFQRRHAL
jgi:hypothetical protein